MDIETGENVGENRGVDVAGIEEEAHVEIEDADVPSPGFSGEDQCSEEITKITEDVHNGKDTFMKVNGR